MSKEEYILFLSPFPFKGKADVICLLCNSNYILSLTGQKNKLYLFLKLFLISFLHASYIFLRFLLPQDL